MGDVINLNRFRKARTKAEQTRGAGTKRVQSGRTKVEKEQTAIERERAERDLDGKKLT